MEFLSENKKKGRKRQSIRLHNGRIYIVAKSSGNFLLDPNYGVQVKMPLEVCSNSTKKINTANGPTTMDVFGLIYS